MFLTLKSKSIYYNDAYGLINTKQGKIVIDKNTTLPQYCIGTYHHKIWSELEKQWYRRNKKGKYILNKYGWRIKKIPENLKLTPLALAIWFLDDGQLNIQNGKALFHTLSFTYKECQYLVHLIKNTFGFMDVGIEKNYSQTNYYGTAHKQFKIFINKGSLLPFVELISPFVVTEDMQYKINLTNFKPRKKLFVVNNKKVKEILKLSKTKLTYPQISTITKIKVTTITAIVNGHNHKQKRFKYKKKRKNNTSGYTGIHFNKKRKKWTASMVLSVNSETIHIHLGHWENKKHAIMARKAAEKLKKQGVRDIKKLRKVKHQIKKQINY